MNKLIQLLTVMAWLLVSGLAIAVDRPMVAFEAMSLKIKLSNDGTGIIQGVVCSKCNYTMVKITTATKAYVNGKQVNIQRAKSRSRKMAGVIFYPDTREVQKITWAE